MSRCLVTGHRGYIGSHLHKALKELGHEVIGIDLVDGRDINGVEGLAEGTDGSFQPHWANFKPEYIFHLACIPRVVYSMEEPVLTMANNVLATSNVLNFARKVGTKRVIYSDSSSVVGNGDGPTSPYALQKLVSEMECKLYADLYGLDTVSLRYFNVYSPDQQAGSAYATAVANFMQHIREGKNPFITGDGEQRRDMANVKDVVSANIFAMEHKEKLGGQHFDVGVGSNISLNEIKDVVLKYFPNVHFDYTPPRAGEVLCTKANMSQLKEIGWESRININEGINECFRGLKRELNDQA
jgi:nucleoside-diphosphate-sugar epimerase